MPEEHELKIHVRRTRARWFRVWHVRIIELLGHGPLTRCVDESFCWTLRGAWRRGEAMKRLILARRAAK